MAMQWYGDYVSFIEEPDEETKAKALVRFIKRIEEETYNIDWDSLKVFYKEPGENEGPFSEIFEEGSVMRTKVWTIAFRVKAER